MSARPGIRIAVPWLHEALAEAQSAGALPALPSLRWLAGRGNASRAPEGEWREWLLAGLGVDAAAELRRWPAGPSLAAAAGAGPGTAPGWAIAQPVHLAAGLDHVRMAPLADAVPTPAEAGQLAATLRSHFAGDVFELADFVDGAWLVRCIEAVDCRTHDPARVAGRNIHDFLPGGPDGARLRSFMNEIQMLLHEHPVNVRRESTRSLPVNALWLWGFGAYDAAPRRIAGADRVALQCDDAWLRSFWRVHGGEERALGQAGSGPGDALVAMTQPPTAEPGEALAEIDSSLLARAARALQSGELRRLELHDGAQVHALDRQSRFRVWRRPALPTAHS